MHAACYLIENHFGNFVMMLASIHVTEDGNDATLLPRAGGRTFIQLEHAQRTLADHAPKDAIVFLKPVQPRATMYTLSEMVNHCKGE